MSIQIPALLAAHCAKTPERRAWLEGLPRTIHSLRERWELTIEAPIDHPYVSCSWVAHARRRDGTRAVLKIGMPHMEAEQEIDGLRFWNGDAAVMLLDSDQQANAMLLERCEPGDALLSIAEPEQDVVVATLLKRLWKEPPPGVFRPLSTLIAHWRQETEQSASAWSDAALVREGLSVLSELAADNTDRVLLATDLHAGNVLRAQREPWLMIDPKPFVGDRAYDVTQHLLNCEDRLKHDARGLVRRMADLAEVNESRALRWLFGRTASEPRSDWSSHWKTDIARELSM